MTATIRTTRHNLRIPRLLLLAALAAGAPLAAPLRAWAGHGSIARAASIVSVHMLDGRSGWALDTRAVVRTTNGGVTWSDVTPPGAAIVGTEAGADFYSERIAWVATAPDGAAATTIYRTVDGGRSWRGVTLRHGEPLPGQRQLDFVDPLHGWMLVDLGAAAGSMAVAIWRTSDGGARWTEVMRTDPPGRSPSGLPFGGDKSGLAFRDASTGYVAGATPMSGYTYLYVTHDGGRSWQRQQLVLPPADRADMVALWPPRFFNPRDGILSATLQGQDQLIYVTRDGGATWRAAGRARRVQAPDFINTRDGWAQASALSGGGVAALYRTRDSGRTWVALHPNARFPDGIALDFVGAHVGFALNPAYSISASSSSPSSLWRTADGGRTWVLLHPYVVPRLPGPGQVAPAAGAPGNEPLSVQASIGLARTRVPALSNILDLRFVDARHGWALGTSCGANGACALAMRTSDDGGQTWYTVAAPPTAPAWIGESGVSRHVRFVRFATRRDGWAFGPGLFVTHDGGRTWTDQSRLGAIAALEPSAGTVWVLTRSCSGGPAGAAPTRCAYGLLASTDDGRTWRRTATLPPLGLPQTQLVRANPRTAWILSWGAQGIQLASTLLSTHDGGRTWSRLTDPCSGDSPVIERLAVGPSGGLWLLCGAEPGAGQELKSFYVSPDGGLHWRLLAAAGQRGADTLPGSGYVAGLQALSERRGLMTLDRDTLYRTGDGGLTWRPIMLPGFDVGAYNLGPITFIDPRHGWLGVQNRVYRTVDGGLHWRRSDLP